ncbi:TetR/AcrR family transcriptional regulator [Acinetobacter ursingii]|uniref:TetR/AcrR family transcriptional regulator n=1 Tax=Acinetobacter ursingii TaxID=108980 RepID=UPI0021CDC977|nr:CerR family C-terminal domain-containing protein [Acinetobacter ursingii]MCU4480919.1 CerR family C-terminal domain-containing protein [Acinetobacter ursingii]MCU4505248.1 CerR family C-terminal domain-containing protein [Acinetobacter ursingii]MCU4569068.1 CerR family C-terminal domain-containing protein [Acinetobacter ursingii]
MSRSRRRDGDLTKAKIIEAAGHLIAQEGLAQTTNKAIAQLAQVDLAAINYHFEGRDGLYKAVLVEAHRHYIDEQQLAELVQSSLSPTRKLEVFFETLIQKLVEKDLWHSKVFIRELFAPSPYLEQFMAHDGARKFHYIRQIISQVSGLDENHPSILPCVLSVVAPCMMLIIASNNVPTPLQNISQMDSQQLLQHLITFSLAGLQAIKQNQP